MPNWFAEHLMESTKEKKSIYKWPNTLLCGPSKCIRIVIVSVVIVVVVVASDRAYKIWNVRCVRGIGGGIERLKPWRHSRGLNKKTDHMQNPKKTKIYTNNNSNNNHNRDRNAQISKQSVIALAINNIFMAKMAEKKRHSNDCSNNRPNEFHSRSLKTFFSAIKM